MQTGKRGSASKTMDWAVDDEMGHGFGAFVAAWAYGRVLSTDFMEEGGKGNVASNELGDKACVFPRKRGEGVLVG